MRTNIAQLVGGATEETIIARVGEGIVNAIGAAETHSDVLEAPHRISRLVLEKGLDAQTAFEILSIDIADISIGQNIGAILRANQAESDKIIAQAKAEERRAMAVAMVQENTREGHRNASQSGRGGSADPHGDGRGVPQRKSRHHGLLPDAEHQS